MVAGAGIVLSVMSIAFLRIVGPLEGKMGITTTEIRVAIFLGIVISTIAILYEIYRKKDMNESNENESKPTSAVKDS